MGGATRPDGGRVARAFGRAGDRADAARLVVAPVPGRRACPDQSQRPADLLPRLPAPGGAAALPPAPRTAAGVAPPPRRRLRKARADAAGGGRVALAVGAGRSVGGVVRAA